MQAGKLQFTHLLTLPSCKMSRNIESWCNRKHYIKEYNMPFILYSLIKNTSQQHSDYAMLKADITMSYNYSKHAF